MDLFNKRTILKIFGFFVRHLLVARFFLIYFCAFHGCCRPLWRVFSEDKSSSIPMPNDLLRMPTTLLEMECWSCNLPTTVNDRLDQTHRLNWFRLPMGKKIREVLHWTMSFKFDSETWPIVINFCLSLSTFLFLMVFLFSKWYIRLISVESFS